MAKVAVILMNLGTPQQPTTKSVKAFLKEFLSDPRVIEVPRLIWWFILRLIILPFRSPKVAKAYQSIWQQGNSPLRLITLQQVEKLQYCLNQELGEEAPLVCHAMTYGGPSLSNVVEQLQEKSVDRTILIPLYPQYSATTTGSVYDQVAKIYQNNRDIPDIEIVKHYYLNPDYIAAMSSSIRQFWQEHGGKSDRLLMSFHGLPQAYVDKGDPYYQQCVKTAENIANTLQLEKNEWEVSFQSRLGRSQWLQPYTSEVLELWGAEKLPSVDVICPAFSVDCLETLEEISEENRAVFLQAGGKDFRYIPCLNDRDDHIEMMKNIVLSRLSGEKNNS